MKWLPWVLLVLLAIGANVAFYVYGKQAAATLAAESEAKRAAQADALKLADAVVQVKADLATMTTARDAALADNEVLQGALERAQKAAPSARVVEVLRVESEPAPVRGEPIPVGPDGREAAGCLLAKGSRLKLAADGLKLQTEAGATAWVITAAAWRIYPEPKTLLQREELHGLYLAEAVAPTPTCSCSPTHLALAGAGGAVATLLLDLGLRAALH